MDRAAFVRLFLIGDLNLSMLPKTVLGVPTNKFLFFFAIGGLIFYALSPILFPDVPGLRQPELLPVYTLMLGLSQLKKDGEDSGDKKE